MSTIGSVSAGHSPLGQAPTVPAAAESPTFTEILSEQRGAREGMTQVLGEALERFDAAWQDSSARQQALLDGVSPEFQSLIEVQLSVSRMNLQTQLLSKAAEAASGLLRRAQQLGGG